MEKRKTKQTENIIRNCACLMSSLSRIKNNYFKKNDSSQKIAIARVKLIILPIYRVVQREKEPGLAIQFQLEGFPDVIFHLGGLGSYKSENASLSSPHIIVCVY